MNDALVARMQTVARSFPHAFVIMLLKESSVCTPRMRQWRTPVRRRWRATHAWCARLRRTGREGAVPPPDHRFPPDGGLLPDGQPLVPYPGAAAAGGGADPPQRFRGFAPGHGALITQACSAVMWFDGPSPPTEQAKPLRYSS